MSGAVLCCVVLRQLEPSAACVDDATRLLYCSLCHHHAGGSGGAAAAVTADGRRCRAHCTHMVRACLAVHLRDVNTAWNDYLRQYFISRWLGSRVVSVLDSVSEGPGFKSQRRDAVG